MTIDRRRFGGGFDVPSSRSTSTDRGRARRCRVPWSRSRTSPRAQPARRRRRARRASRSPPGGSRRFPGAQTPRRCTRPRRCASDPKACTSCQSSASCSAHGSLRSRRIPSRPGATRSGVNPTQPNFLISGRPVVWRAGRSTVTGTSPESSSTFARSARALVGARGQPWATSGWVRRTSLTAGTPPSPALLPSRLLLPLPASRRLPPRSPPPHTLPLSPFRSTPHASGGAST